jgi:hypothetical protein
MLGCVRALYSSTDKHTSWYREPYCAVLRPFSSRGLSSLINLVVHKPRNPDELMSRICGITDRATPLPTLISAFPRSGLATRYSTLSKSRRLLSPCSTTSPRIRCKYHIASCAVQCTPISKSKQLACDTVEYLALCTSKGRLTVRVDIEERVQQLAKIREWR